MRRQGHRGRIRLFLYYMLPDFCKFVALLHIRHSIFSLLIRLCYFNKSKGPRPSSNAYLSQLLSIPFLQVHINLATGVAATGTATGTNEPAPKEDFDFGLTKCLVEIFAPGNYFYSTRSAPKALVGSCTCRYDRDCTEVSCDGLPEGWKVTIGALARIISCS